ncbi:MAG: hypothetical protein FWE16_06095 [Firmicutes bacterium]|nr:hypothetical protein [Bacillota bacterium]
MKEAGFVNSTTDDVPVFGLGDNGNGYAKIIKSGNFAGRIMSDKNHATTQMIKLLTAIHYNDTDGMPHSSGEDTHTRAERMLKYRDGVPPRDKCTSENLGEIVSCLTDTDIADMIKLSCDIEAALRGIQKQRNQENKAKTWAARFSGLKNSIKTFISPEMAE